MANKHDGFLQILFILSKQGAWLYDIPAEWFGSYIFDDVQLHETVHEKCLKCVV